MNRKTYLKNIRISTKDQKKILIAIKKINDLKMNSDSWYSCWEQNIISDESYYLEASKLEKILVDVINEIKKIKIKERGEENGK